MKKVIRLTENDVRRMVQQALNEWGYDDWKTMSPDDEWGGPDSDDLTITQQDKQELYNIINSAIKENEEYAFDSAADNNPIDDYDTFFSNLVDWDDDMNNLIYSIMDQSGYNSEYSENYQDTTKQWVVDELYSIGRGIYQDWLDNFEQNEQPTGLAECVNRVIKNYLR